MKLIAATNGGRVVTLTYKLPFYQYLYHICKHYAHGCTHRNGHTSLMSAHQYHTRERGLINGKA
jgi:hypothetical protein